MSEISLLGSPEKLSWSRDEKGLKIKLPVRKPGNSAYVFKIVLDGEVLGTVEEVVSRAMSSTRRLLDSVCLAYNPSNRRGHFLACASGGKEAIVERSRRGAGQRESRQLDAGGDRKDAPPH
jgi:hypothetical protein